MTSHSATIVVLAYGKEDDLERCIDAILHDRSEGDELIVVDNGFAGGPERLTSYAGQIRLIGSGDNLGFTGGCNLAARESSGDTLIFVNSDAIVQPGAFAPLIDAANQPQVGIACGSLRLADEPELVNSAGNPIHYIGVTWAGHCGEPAADHAISGEISCATGGFFAIRRGVWDQLGGFHDVYFAYHEDADLSMRTHLIGLQVFYEPAAVALHHYEFARNPLKMYLVERNRLLLVATVYPKTVRRAVLPMIILTEPMFLALALMQGWGRQKLRSWAWLVRHRKLIRTMRRSIQATREISEAEFARLFVDKIEPPMIESPPGMSIVNQVLARYWSIAKRSVR